VSSLPRNPTRISGVRARPQLGSMEPRISRGEPVALPPDELPVAVKRAVLYLRVSTPSQVNTDYDPEGISIPAQRVACLRKADQLGAHVIDEYIEPGRSATRMDQRPAFQSMFERIRTERDVDYVVVHKLSRMNRNRVDDAFVLMSLRKFRVTLVSATESIDNTPAGQLLHGILAAFNEFRSAEDGADISYKMGEKARRGGTLGRAPLGYLNIRDHFEGREVRSVAIDPERAPFVRLAFELYATGDWTLDGLAQELTSRGLRTRASRFPGSPISSSKLQAMLRDRYYIGYVSYKGAEYPGRHEPLIDDDLFERVQIALDAKSTSRERQRVHHHYLKGSVWCGRCHDQNVDRRMIIARAKGQGGIYFYYFCRGRQEHACSAPYVHIDAVEEAVARRYGTLQLDPEFADRVREALYDALADQEGAAKLLHRQLTNQLLKLDRQEENLLDLAADGSLAKDKIRTRLTRVQRDRSKLQEELGGIDVGLEAGAAVIEAALDLLKDPEEMYRQMGPDQRRLLNQAFFEKLYIDDSEVTGLVLTKPFGDLVGAQQVLREQRGSKKQDPTSGQASSVNPFLAIQYGKGSSKRLMVEVSGLEPPTSTLRTSDDAPSPTSENTDSPSSEPDSD